MACSSLGPWLQEKPGEKTPGLQEVCCFGEVCCQVKDVRDKIGRLRDIKDERETERIFFEMQLEEYIFNCRSRKSPPPVLSTPITSRKGEGWKLVTSVTKRKIPAIPKGL